MSTHRFLVYPNRQKLMKDRENRQIKGVSKLYFTFSFTG